MRKLEASRIASQSMKNGNNCCQSILLAAQKVWGIPVGDDILAATSLFREGMGSGCTCGALAGMIMVAGIMENGSSRPLGLKLAQRLHDRFKEEFGTTCCRAIRKKQFFHNIGNKACIELTAQTAQIMVQELEGFWEFFWATGLGQLPATIVYSYVGGMLTGSVRMMVFGLLILFALSAVIVAGRQIWRDRKQKA